MDQYADASDEKLLKLRDNVQRSMELMAQSLGTHLPVIAICMVMVVAEKYGRQGLEPVIFAARELSKSLIDEERAEARVAKRERRQNRP